MLDKFTKKLAEKMGKSVQETVKETTVPLTAGIKQLASNKVDLYSRIIRFGVLVLLFVEGTRRVAGESQTSESPNHIIINNYLGKNPGEKER